MTKISQREARRLKARKEFPYAAEFDRLMSEQFGGEFKTEWSLFCGPYGGYITTRNGKKLTKQQALYGRGLSNGIVAAENFYEATP